MSAEEVQATLDKKIEMVVNQDFTHVSPMSSYMSETFCKAGDIETVKKLLKTNESVMIRLNTKKSWELYIPLN